MIGVQRDLQRLDVTIALEVLFKLLRRQILRDPAHEDVVINNFLGVGAEKVVVKRKGSGGLAFGEFEVAHLFAGKVEFLLLWDRHDGRIEGSVEVTTDLWHALEHDTRFILEYGSEAGACSLLLGQVVQVEIVLGSLSVVDCHFFFGFGFRVFLCFFL